MRSKIFKFFFISIRKSYEKSGNSICLFLQQFHTVAGCDIASYLFNVLKRLELEQASSSATSLDMIVRLGT